jgi:hypothetical protein
MHFFCRAYGTFGFVHLLHLYHTVAALLLQPPCTAGATNEKCNMKNEKCNMNSPLTPPPA